MFPLPSISCCIKNIYYIVAVFYQQIHLSLAKVGRLRRKILGCCFRSEISDGDFFYEMWWLALFLAWLGSSNHKLCNEQVLCGPSILILDWAKHKHNVIAVHTNRYWLPFHIYESIWWKQPPSMKWDAMFNIVSRQQFIVRQLIVYHYWVQLFLEVGRKQPTHSIASSVILRSFASSE